MLGQYNRQQQGLPAIRVNKQTQPFNAFRASYYSKHYKCIQPIWNAPVCKPLLLGLAFSRDFSSKATNMCCQFQLRLFLCHMPLAAKPCRRESVFVQRPQVLPPVRMAPRTRQQYVQHVGTVLNLHKDTVRFTQHLYARLKVGSFFTTSPSSMLCQLADDAMKPHVYQRQVSTLLTPS